MSRFVEFPGTVPDPDYFFGNFLRIESVDNPARSADRKVSPAGTTQINSINDKAFQNGQLISQTKGGAGQVTLGYMISKNSIYSISCFIRFNELNIDGISSTAVFQTTSISTPK